MLTAKLDVLRGTRSAPEEHPGADRLPGWAKWSATIIAVAGAIFLWVWSEGSEGRAVRAMPQAERKALYTRTLESLASVCSQPDDAMRDYCRLQARLVMEFQECDPSCRDLADRHLSRAQAPR